MAIWLIARKDLAIFFRERGWIIQLFALPLLFVLIFSGILGGVGGADPDERIALAVADEDGGPIAQRLLAALEDTGRVRVDPIEETEARRRMEARELARVLLIPSGAGGAAGQAVPTAGDATGSLRLIVHPDAGLEETETVRLVVEGVVQDLLLEDQIAAAAGQLAETQAQLPPEQRVFAGDGLADRLRAQWASSRQRPLVTVTQRTPAGAQDVEEDAAPAFDLAQVAVPGFMVLFAFLTAQATAVSIYQEKRVGSFRRLLAAPISKAELLAGKALPNVLIVIVQVIVILTFGVVGLPLLGRAPISLSSDPLALVLLVLAMALASTGLGILIASLARTENQIGGLASMLLWATGVLGGSMIPLFFLEQFLGPLPRIVPQYWANRGFENLLIRGLGLSAVVPQIAALLLFALGFFAIGLWRFDYE